MKIVCVCFAFGGPISWKFEDLIGWCQDFNAASKNYSTLDVLRNLSLYIVQAKNTQTQ